MKKFNTLFISFSSHFPISRILDSFLKIPFYFHFIIITSISRAHNVIQPSVSVCGCMPTTKKSSIFLLIFQFSDFSSFPPIILLLIFLSVSDIFDIHAHNH